MPTWVRFPSFCGLRFSLMMNCEVVNIHLGDAVAYPHRLFGRNYVKNAHTNNIYARGRTLGPSPLSRKGGLRLQKVKNTKNLGI